MPSTCVCSRAISAPSSSSCAAGVSTHGDSDECPGFGEGCEGSGVSVGRRRRTGGGGERDSVDEALGALGEETRCSVLVRRSLLMVRLLPLYVRTRFLGFFSSGSACEGLRTGGSQSGTTKEAMDPPRDLRFSAGGHGLCMLVPVCSACREDCETHHSFSYSPSPHAHHSFSPSGMVRFSDSHCTSAPSGKKTPGFEGRASHFVLAHDLQPNWGVSVKHNTGKTQQLTLTNRMGPTVAFGMSR